MYVFFIFITHGAQFVITAYLPNFKTFFGLLNS